MRGRLRKEDGKNESKCLWYLREKGEARGEIFGTGGEERQWGSFEEMKKRCEA